MIFEAIHNFRDCGGYATRDGRRMRRGKLFRTAHFPLASESDLETMRSLGLSAIVDLRRPNEREMNPCRRWVGFDARLIEHDIANGIVLPPHLAAFERAGESEAQAAAAMTQIYCEMPADPMFVGLLRDYFAVLAEEDGAVLVHCAAGKDRTGLAVALTHRLLGVSEADMIADYLATNASVDARFAEAQPMRAFLSREGRVASDGAIRYILGVEEPLLRAALDAIVTHYGSIDAYLANVAHVTPARRAAIVERLTEEGL